MKKYVLLKYLYFIIFKKILSIFIGQYKITIFSKFNKIELYIFNFLRIEMYNMKPIILILTSQYMCGKTKACVMLYYHSKLYNLFILLIFID